MTIRAPVGPNHGNYIDLWLILTTRTMTKMIWNCFLQPPTWVTCSESPAANLESSSQGARPPSYSHGDCCWGWWWCCSWGLSYRRPCLPISASSASQNQFQILLFPTKQAAHCRASSMFTAAAKRSQRWAKLKSWTKSRKRGNTQPSHATARRQKVYRTAGGFTKNGTNQESSWPTLPSREFNMKEDAFIQQ